MYYVPFGVCESFWGSRKRRFLLAKFDLLCINIIRVCCFFPRHRVISAANKVCMAEANHELALMRQEEKNVELLRSIEGEHSICNRQKS